MASTTMILSTIAILLAAAVLVVGVLRDALPKHVERNAKLDELETRIYVLHSEAQDAGDRVMGLRSTRDRQANEHHRMESDIRKIDKAIEELEHQPPLFVHEVGDPQQGMAKFVVELRHESNTKRPRANGERVAVNPIWRYANVAEVWANTQEEARQLVDVAFPTKLGFTKNFSAKPSNAERLVEQMLRKDGNAQRAEGPPS